MAIQMPVHQDQQSFEDWQTKTVKRGIIELAAGRKLGNRVAHLQPCADESAVPSIDPELAALMGVQPHYAHPMVLLQKYSNSDKHHAIRMAAARGVVQRLDEPFFGSDRSMRPIEVGDVLTTTRPGTPVVVDASMAVHVLRPDGAVWVAPARELDHLYRHVCNTVIPTLVTGFALTKSLPPHIELGDTGDCDSERIRHGGWQSAYERMAAVTDAAYHPSRTTAPQLPTRQT